VLNPDAKTADFQSVKQGIHILVVDDEAPIRAVVRVRLEAAGFRVTEARNGLEALDVVRADRPSLIISDFQMPVMNGMAMAVSMRADPKLADLPIVLLTARGYVLDPLQVRDTNIRTVIGKPFSLKSLMEQVYIALPGISGGLAA
jgi:CheY-like chemotaxis protein